MITPEYREGLDDLASHYKEVLTLLGEDPEREGLQKTPMRVAKAMQVLTRGYSQDPHKVLTDALFKEDYNQMVLVKDIDVFSLCELRQGTRGVYPQRIHHRTEQDSTRSRHILTSSAGAGTPHTADTRVHRGHTPSPRSDGSD